MNASHFLKHCSTAVLLMTLAILFAGCATQKKIDWAGRIGNYTFDQAVTELGPPDKQAKLQDGTVVAEWLIRRGYTYVYSSPALVSSYPYSFGGPSAGVASGTSPDFYLRLTFAADNRLKAWKKFAK